MGYWFFCPCVQSKITALLTKNKTTTRKATTQCKVSWTFLPVHNSDRFTKSQPLGSYKEEVAKHERHI